MRFTAHDGDAARIDANVSYQSGQYYLARHEPTGRGNVNRPRGGAAPQRELWRYPPDAGHRWRSRGAGTWLWATEPHQHVWQSGGDGRRQLYRSRASIDLTNLSDEAEATQSVVQATLTEGAIGYRRFNVISGQKAMAVIRLADGSTPPFGAEVFNRRRQQTGILNDGGSVYLSGIRAGEQNDECIGKGRRNAKSICRRCARMSL